MTNIRRITVPVDIARPLEPRSICMPCTYISSLELLQLLLCSELVCLCPNPLVKTVGYTIILAKAVTGLAMTFYLLDSKAFKLNSISHSFTTQNTDDNNKLDELDPITTQLSFEAKVAVLAY